MIDLSHIDDKKIYYSGKVTDKELRTLLSLGLVRLSKLTYYPTEISDHPGQDFMDFTSKLSRSQIIVIMAIIIVKLGSEYANV